MRALLAALLTVSLSWATSASAQPVYGDDEDFDDGPAAAEPEGVPTPPPPPAAAAAPAAPPEALPPAPDDQQTWRYNGPHAINAQYGTGFCNLRGVHHHPYPPFDDHLFQEQDDGYNFLGDPTDFGYAGDDLYWYAAVHPIAIGWGIGWCFMNWAHRHFYQPWGPYFSACGPYSCYSGPFDSYYWRWRGYWTPYWGSYYPRYYRGGLYARYRMSASPGRWAHVGSRHGGGHLGLPRGYARPHATGSLRPTASPYSRLPHAAPMRAPHAGPIRMTPHAGPRMMGSRGSPHGFAAPRMHHGAPRLASPKMHSSPRFSAPKSFGSKSFGRSLGKGFSFGKKR